MNYKLGLLVFQFISLIFFPGFVSSQEQSETDSIKAIIAVEPNKEKQVDNYIELAKLYSDTYIDSTIYFINQSLGLAKQIGYKKGEAKAYYALSYFNDRTGLPAEAIESLENAILIYSELGDSSKLVGCYNNMGVFYSYGTSQTTGLEYFIKAMELAESIGETYALSEAYGNIGSFYEYVKEYFSALKYYNKALEIDLKLKNYHNIALSYLTIGRINLKLERFDNARDSLNKAKELLYEVKDNYRQIELYINLAYYYSETNQPDSAYYYIQSAKEINIKNEYDRLSADIKTLEGDLLFKQKKYRECLRYYDEAIILYNKQHTLDGLYDIYNNMATAYSQLGMHNKAYEMLQNAQKLNDQLKPNEIARILGEFESNEAIKEEKEKIRLEQEILIQKNRNEVILIRAKFHRAVISIAFLVILIASVIYFYFEKRKHSRHFEQNYKIIQEQKSLLEENFLKLKHNEKKLSQLNATKDKFFSIIAHDLKNPFNVLIGLSDAVINNPDIRNSDEFEQIIEGMFETAKSGYNLLDNLLEWARSQTGGLEYNPGIVDMGEIINLNTAFFKETAKAKKIEICISDPSSYKVFADYNMVNFVVRNLLNNALKFSFPESKIDIVEHEKDERYFFTIMDYGIGMNKETVDKLFKIESTDPKIGTNNEKGTGLGLIICKEFITKNKGEIWVDSVEGKGSCFHFSLPVKAKIT